MNTETQARIIAIVANAFNFQLKVNQRFLATQRLTDGSFAGVDTSVPIVNPTVTCNPGKQIEISVEDLGLTPETEARIFNEIASSLPYDSVTEDIISA